MITSIRMQGSGRRAVYPWCQGGPGGREMHRMGLWWRQPDHYDWLSDYLAARRLKPCPLPIGRHSDKLGRGDVADAVQLVGSTDTDAACGRRGVRREPRGNGIGVAAELANAISIPDVFDNGGTGHRSGLCDRERPALRDAGVRGIWWPGGLRGVFSFRSAAGFQLAAP